MTARTTRVGIAVAALDAWLETTRGPDGYGGPVAHWWQQSLLYTGSGRDWRYEGIIAGYLSLWERSRDERWLQKARRAGDDLLRGQLEDGHFAASAFELNPASGGTPHEAAADCGLLQLALTLKKHRRNAWEQYALGAERNLRGYYLGRLWDSERRIFRDAPKLASFVPNKAATAAEALFLFAELTGDSAWAERYALPNLEQILEHQRRGGKLDGAIAQNSFGRRKIEKYFPIYIARCIPALLRGSQWPDGQRYVEAAFAAMGFITRQLNRDGWLPTVVYPNGSAAWNPCWIAALGDVLYAAELLRAYGYDADLDSTRERLLDGQDSSGGFQTARGFATQAGGRPGKHADLRDLLHVAGWNDKALRYLATQIDGELPPAVSTRFEAECSFRGRILRMIETPAALEFHDRKGLCYRWTKGRPWAETADTAFWLR